MVCRSACIWCIHGLQTLDLWHCPPTAHAYGLRPQGPPLCASAIDETSLVRVSKSLLNSLKMETGEDIHFTDVHDHRTVNARAQVSGVAAI